jgi:hypothetical protein
VQRGERYAELEAGIRKISVAVEKTRLALKDVLIRRCRRMA